MNEISTTTKKKAGSEFITGQQAKRKKLYAGHVNAAAAAAHTDPIDAQQRPQKTLSEKQSSMCATKK